METLTDDIRMVMGQIAYQRACQRAAIAAADLLEDLDARNALPLGSPSAGRIVRHLGAATESAMCALRAALAEMPTV